METKMNFKGETESLKTRYKQLKEVIDDLEGLGVLVNERLRKFRQDIQDILSFCDGDYKFSFLVQGEMNAGKSTCLNALLGQRILAVSSVPETNFITCVVHDAEAEIPLLYKTKLSKIYNPQTSSFYICPESLEFTNVSGTEEIYQHLNFNNKDWRKKLKDLEKQLTKNEKDENQKVKEEFYKDVKLDDTVYVIKCRMTSLQEKIANDFILNRIQLIDFPGMFEYGQNRITEVYKIFEDNTQGLINILHPSGYEHNIMKKLQNYEKYPNRLLIVVNKIDQINVENETKNNETKLEEKSKGLIKNLQTSLLEVSSNSNDELQKNRYLQMSQDVPSIVHFAAGKEEMINTYLTHYHNPEARQEEKGLSDTILKSFVEDDQNYRAFLRRANNEGKPFAEMTCFNSFEKRKNNLFDQIQKSLADKFRNRFNDLISVEYPRKVNLIIKELVEFIGRMVKDNNSEKKKPDNTHIYHRCDGCEADPIVGTRYHCMICEDFDYCDRCKATKSHPLHEFETIEKFSFKIYIEDFCNTHISAAFGTLLEFREKFISQLEDSFSGIKKAFESNKDPKFFSDLLNLHCTGYYQLREEIDQQLQQKKIIFLAAHLATLSKLEEWHGLNISSRIILIETLSSVIELIEDIQKTLIVFYAFGANLMQNIITCTSNKHGSFNINQHLYENINISALLFTNAFDSKKRTNNLKEFDRQTLVWTDGFNRLYSRLTMESLELLTDVQKKIQQGIALSELFEMSLQDDEKAKNVNQKLKETLEKLNHISKYNLE